MNVAVVIPTYNRQSLLKRAIDSVLNQTLSPCEIIVVDDGSSDNTLNVLNEYRDSIKIITQKNRGVSAARNRGVYAACSKWVLFLDSDDVWHKDKLKIQTNFHKKNPHILFSHTNEVWIRDEKIISQKKKHKKPTGECFYENLDFCKISPSTVMIKKELFEKCGGFDEELKVCEDYDLWLRVLKRVSVGLIDDALTYKYAGGWEQLSFGSDYHDLYQIKALMKHLPDSRVESVILRKLSILHKGAKKYKNDYILSFCQNTLNKLNLV